MRSPPTMRSPHSGLSSPASRRSMVVLPRPEGPRRQTQRPSGPVSVVPFAAAFVPTERCTSSMRISAVRRAPFRGRSAPPASSRRARSRSNSTRACSPEAGISSDGTPLPAGTGNPDEAGVGWVRRNGEQTGLHQVVTADLRKEPQHRHGTATGEHGRSEPIVRLSCGRRDFPRPINQSCTPASCSASAPAMRGKVPADDPADPVAALGGSA